MASSGQLLMAAFAMGLLVLMVAFFFPYIINLDADNAEENINVSTGDSEELNDYLDLTLDATNTTPTNRTVNVSLSNPDTLNETTITELSDVESQTSELDEENVTVEPTKVNSSSAELLVKYPRTFGWSTPAKVFMEHLGLLIALLALVLVVGLLLVPRGNV